MTEDKPTYHIPEVRCYRLAEFIAGLTRLKERQEQGQDVTLQVNHLHKLISTHLADCSTCHSNMLQDQLFFWGQVRIVDPEDPRDDDLPQE